MNAIQIAFDQLRVVTVKLMPGEAARAFKSFVAGATLEWFGRLH